MKKEKIGVYIFGIIMMLLMVGCGKGIEGKYNAYNENILIELTIKGEEATLNVNSVELQSSGFLGLGISQSDVSESMTGKVDTSKKVINFSEENLKVTYIKKDKGLELSIAGFGNNIIFYPESSEEFAKNITDFEQSKETVNYSESDELEDNNFEEEIATSSTEDIEYFLQEEMDSTIANIQSSYSELLVGKWIGEQSYGANKGDESVVTINSDMTYVATDKDAYGRLDVTYTGELKFAESNDLRSKIEMLFNNKEIENLTEVDTYDKYSKIVGQKESRLEMINKMTTKGKKYGTEINDIDLESIVNLRLYNGELDFQDVIGIGAYSKYLK